MKRALIIVAYVVMGGLIYSICIAGFEHFAINSLVEDFISQAVLQESISTNTIKYYAIPTSNPDELEAFTNEQKTRIGQVGDIISLPGEPLPGIPLLSPFMGFQFGYHSAIFVENTPTNNTIVESSGIGVSGIDILKSILVEDRFKNVDINNYPNKVSSYFFSQGGSSNPRVSEFYGLRVKGATLEDRQVAAQYAIETYEKKSLYNYLFYLNTKSKYYCSDLVSRSYESIKDHQGLNKYDLNSDGFIVSNHDLVLANDTYLYMYFKIKNQIAHVYYLDKNI